MLIALEIFALITMCTLIFVSIWGFIILKQIFNQVKYKNYLMEKLTQHIYMIYKKDVKLTNIQNDDNNNLEKH